MDISFLINTVGACTVGYAGLSELRYHSNDKNCLLVLCCNMETKDMVFLFKYA